MSPCLAMQAQSLIGLRLAQVEENSHRNLFLLSRPLSLFPLEEKAESRFSLQLILMLMQCNVMQSAHLRKSPGALHTLLIINIVIGFEVASLKASSPPLPQPLSQTVPFALLTYRNSHRMRTSTFLVDR